MRGGRPGMEWSEGVVRGMGVVVVVCVCMCVCVPQTPRTPPQEQTHMPVLLAVLPAHVNLGLPQRPRNHACTMYVILYICMYNKCITTVA